MRMRTDDKEGVRETECKEEIVRGQKRVKYLDMKSRLAQCRERARGGCEY